MPFLETLHAHARVFIDLHGQPFPRTDLPGARHCEGYVDRNRDIRTWVSLDGIPPDTRDYFGIALNINPQPRPRSLSTLPNSHETLSKLLI